jgi:hypothetical protein
MGQRKCSTCGKAAFAYRKEPDGSKTYLCDRHIPGPECLVDDIHSGQPVARQPEAQIAETDHARRWLKL